MRNALEKRNAGRPTKFNEQIAQALIFDIITSCEPVAEITKRHKIAEKTFYLWIHAYDEFRIAYLRALETRAMNEFESVEQELADLEKYVVENDAADPREKHVRIQLARLKTEHRRWRLSKMNRQVFGDKLDMTADVSVQVDARDQAWLEIQSRAVDTAYTPTQTVDSSQSNDSPMLKLQE